MATSEKVGKLTRATSEEYEFTLAEWVPPEERYQRRYRPVTPASRLIQGSDDQIAPDETIAEWHIDDWSGGMGYKLWEAGRYNKSTGLHPRANGGLIAAWYVAEAGTNHVIDAEALSLAGDTIYAVGSTEFNEWDWLINDDWVTLNGATGLADPHSFAIADEPNVGYISDSTAIDKVTSISAGTISSDFTVGLNDDHMVIAFQGRLFDLSGSQLYEINLTTGAAVAVAGSAAFTNVARFTAGASRSKMAISDVGPIWHEDLGGGRLVMREYNVAEDTEQIVSSIGVSHGFVQSVHYSDGVYMALVVANALSSNAADKPTYLWLHANGVSSLAGPIPEHTGSAFSSLIAGRVGDDIVIAHNEAIIVYRLSTGAFHISAVDLDNIGTHYGAVVYGSDIFLAIDESGGDFKIYRIQPDLYDATNIMDLSTGSYDFGYRGVDKLFTDVTVQLAEPLDAGDQLHLRYSVDGEASVVVAGFMTDADGTTKRWALTNVVGKTLEWRIRLELNGTANTPEILSITTRAQGAEYRPEWIMQIDMTDEHSATKIEELRSLALRHEILTFDDPYEAEAFEAPESFQVTVEDLYLPPEQDDGYLVATIRLRATETV